MNFDPDRRRNLDQVQRLCGTRCCLGAHLKSKGNGLEYATFAYACATAPDMGWLVVE